MLKPRQLWGRWSRILWLLGRVSLEAPTLDLSPALALVAVYSLYLGDGADSLHALEVPRVGVSRVFVEEVSSTVDLLLVEREHEVHVGHCLCAGVFQRRLVGRLRVVLNAVHIGDPISRYGFCSRRSTLALSLLDSVL